MNPDVSGDKPVVDDGRISRRRILLGAAMGAASLVLTKAVTAFLGGTENALTGTTVAASSGNNLNLVGNAAGNYPQAALDAVRAAMNVIIVQYADDGVVSMGSTLKTEISEGGSDDVIFPTAMHVLTRHGEKSVRDIANIWIGHPGGELGFTILNAAGITFAVPRDYDSSDPAHDAALVRIPRSSAPGWLARAPGLELNTADAVIAGEHLLLGGMPAGALPAPTDTGLQAASVYMDVMTVSTMAPAAGCIGMEGDAAAGVSGGCIADKSGKIVAMATAWRADHTVVAVPASTIAALAQAR